MTVYPDRGRITQIEIQAFFGGKVLLPLRTITSKRVQEMIVAQVTAGKYLVTTPLGSAQINPGEVCVIPADTAVEFEHIPDENSGVMTSQWVHLRATVMGAVDISTLLPLPLKVAKHDAKAIGTDITEFLAHRNDSSDINHWVRQHRVAFSLLEKVMSLAGPGTGLEHKIAGLRRLEPTITQIHQNLAAPLTIQQLAKWAHLSVSRLHALFVKDLGYAPMSYVRLIRLREAQRLLACTDESIASVAAQCGFVSQFHFARCFKTSVGMAPTAYRQEHQPGN